MLQTMMVKLDPSPEQYQMLLDTMHRFNEACNFIAGIAFQMHTANKIEIHKAIYYEVREKFNLPSQLAVRAISKVAEAYKRDCGHVSRANRPTRDEFRCESCGFAGPADHIAAMNIAFRAEVNLPIVAGKHLTPVTSPSPSMDG